MFGDPMSSNTAVPKSPAVFWISASINIIIRSQRTFVAIAMNVSEGAKLDKTGVGVLHQVMRDWILHETFRSRCCPLFRPSWEVIFKDQGIHRKSMLETNSKKA